MQTHTLPVEKNDAFLFEQTDDEHTHECAEFMELFADFTDEEWDEIFSDGVIIP